MYPRYRNALLFSYQRFALRTRFFNSGVANTPQRFDTRRNTKTRLCVSHRLVSGCHGYPAQVILGMVNILYIYSLLIVYNNFLKNNPHCEYIYCSNHTIYESGTRHVYWRVGFLIYWLLIFCLTDENIWRKCILICGIRMGGHPWYKFKFKYMYQCFK